MVDLVPCKNLQRKVWKDSPRLLVKLAPSFNSRTSGPKPNLSAIITIHSMKLALMHVFKSTYRVARLSLSQLFYTTRRHLANSNNKDNHKCYSSTDTTQFH